MKCTGQELFNALTQREMIQIFTGTYQPTLPEVSGRKDRNSSILVQWVPGRGVGRHIFDTDPDPTCHFDADPDTDSDPDPVIRNTS
jgi:hypothetical protein